MRAWLSLVVRYAFAQGFAQIAGFVAGILVVRSLSKVEYAQYSIAVAVISAIGLLADAGISSTLLSQGSGLVQNRSAMSRLLSTGLAFRLRIGIIVMTVGAGILVVLISQNGASSLETGLIAAVVVLNFLPTLATGVMQTYLRLTLQYKFVQRLTVLIAVARAVLVAIAVFAHVSYVTPLLLITLAGSLAAWILTRRRVASELDVTGKADPEYLPAFRRSARSVLPMLIVLVSAEQILYFVLSFRSTTDVIAELSAMSRFSAAFIIVDALFADIAAPYFARLARQKGLLLRRFFAFAGGYLGFCSLLVGAVAIFAPQLLWLLGAQYSGLRTELVITAASFALIEFAYSLNALNQSRGWLRMSWLFLPLTAIWIVIAFLIPAPLSIGSAAWLFLFQGLPALVTQFVRFAFGVRDSSIQTA